MEFQEQKAIYLQIAERIEENILTQKWIERIPAIRELALEFKVNPNTVARTYAYLESQGVIHIQRGVGYFVAKDAIAKILSLRKTIFIEKTVPEFFKMMTLLGLTLDDLKEISDEK